MKTGHLKTILVAAVLLSQSTCGVVSQPPKLLPSASRDIRRTVTHDHRARSYLLHIPRGYHPERPTPAVLVFHGGLSNAENMRQTTKMHVVADTAGAGLAQNPHHLRSWRKIACPHQFYLRRGHDRLLGPAERLRPRSASYCTQTGNVRQSIYSHCNQDASVQLVTVVGGGHAWPGGEPAWRGGDVPTREINASEVLWAFFAAHPKQ